MKLNARETQLRYFRYFNWVHRLRCKDLIGIPFGVKHLYFITISFLPLRINLISSLVEIAPARRTERSWFRCLSERQNSTVLRTKNESALDWKIRSFALRRFWWSFSWRQNLKDLWRSFRLWNRRVDAIRFFWRWTSSKQDSHLISEY